MMKACKVICALKKICRLGNVQVSDMKFCGVLTIKSDG